MNSPGTTPAPPSSHSFAPSPSRRGRHLPGALDSIGLDGKGVLGRPGECHAARRGLSVHLRAGFGAFAVRNCTLSDQSASPTSTRQAAIMSTSSRNRPTSRTVSGSSHTCESGEYPVKWCIQNGGYQSCSTKACGASGSKHRVPQPQESRGPQ